MKYSYDTTGVVFNYFQVAIISIILVPYTYSLLSRSTAKKVQEVVLPCCKEKEALLAKKKTISWKRPLFLAIAWAYLAYVFHQAATQTLEEILWNPYEILGVDESTPTTKVKSAFRKLARQWHPDKVSKDMQEEAGRKYAELTKAYKTLTNEDAKALFDEFGHPDGKQAISLGIALPSWLVEKKNAFMVLGVYALIFGVALPLWVANWWRTSKNFTKDRIMHETMGRYYRELKDPIKMRALIDLLATAEEFRLLDSMPEVGGAADPEKVKELADKVKSALFEQSREKFEKSRVYGSLKYHYKVTVLLFAHFLRVKVSDPVLRAQQILIIGKSAHLAQGMLQIAISRNWMNVAALIIELAQDIVQAIYFSQSPLRQLPHLLDSKEATKALNSKKKKIDTVMQLLEIEPETLKEMLTPALSTQEFNVMKQVALKYPLMKITKAKFGVLGEKHIVPSAIVTLIVKLKLCTVEQVVEDKSKGVSSIDTTTVDPADEEEPEKKWWKREESQVVPAFCPYFPEVKRPAWWVLLGDSRNGRLITMTKVVLTKEKEAIARLQFQAPPNSGRWVFQVHVKTDSFSGCDAKIDVTLKVEPLSVAPPSTFEDDISEPEFDSLAGAMAAVKENREPKGEFDDSDSDDDVVHGELESGSDEDSAEEVDSDFVE